MFMPDRILRMTSLGGIALNHGLRAMVSFGMVSIEFSAFREGWLTNLAA